MSRKYHLKCQCCLSWYLFCWCCHALAMAPLQLGVLLLMTQSGDQLRACSLWCGHYIGAVMSPRCTEAASSRIFPPHRCRRSCFYSLHLHTHKEEESCMLQVRVRSPLLTAALLSCTWNGTTEISTFPPSINLSQYTTLQYRVLQ